MIYICGKCNSKQMYRFDPTSFHQICSKCNAMFVGELNMPNELVVDNKRICDINKKFEYLIGSLLKHALEVDSLFCHNTAMALSDVNKELASILMEESK